VPRMCRIMKPWSLCQQESRKFVCCTLTALHDPLCCMLARVPTSCTGFGALLIPLCNSIVRALTQAPAHAAHDGALLSMWRQKLLAAAADTLYKRALHCRYKWASQEMAHAQGPDLSRVSQKGLTHRQEQVCPHFPLRLLRYSVHARSDN